MKKRMIWIVAEGWKETHLLDRPLQPITYLTWKELKQKFRPKCKKEAILFLMKRYSLHYQVAQMYWNQIRNNPSLSSSLPKVVKLSQMKEELVSHHLLEENDLFRSQIAHFSFQICTPIPELLEDQALLEWLKKESTVIEEEEELSFHAPTVIHFTMMEQEVTYVALQIISLLEQGILPEQISLWDVPDTYTASIHRIFDWFHLPVALKSRKTLASTLPGARFLKALEQGMTKEAFQQQLEIESSSEITKKLVAVLNQYPNAKWDETFYACIKEEFQQTIVDPPKKKGVIEERSFLDPNQYVFLLGFNQGHVPKVWKDEDYFCDCEKEQLHLSTSFLLNQEEEKNLKRLLFSHPHLVITYKDQTPFEAMYPSSLLEKWELPIQEGTLSRCYLYSDLYNQLQLAKKKEARKKYNTMDADYSKLDHHYPNLPFATYDNQFTGIAKEKILAHFSSKLLLSYSHLDHFYRCGFRYYCADILKIKPYEETFALFLGTLFHELLSLAFLPNFDFETAWQKRVNQRNCTAKEQFFLEERKEDFKFILAVIQKQDSYSTFREALYETKVYCNWELEVPVTLMGVFDKVKYKVEDQKTLLAIIDYKTGTPELNLNHAIYGINLQLPIYLYLARHSKEWKNPVVVGMYLQKILPKELLYDPKKDYQLRKEEQYRLEGYSIDQEEYIEQFDCTYQDSEVIKSMKMTQNGFSAYAKTLSAKKMDQLCDLVEQQVQQAASDILNGQYQIAPKRIGDENLGCQFCPFLDLCYRQEKNLVELEEYHHLEFLGGEEDAQMDE